MMRILFHDLKLELAQRKKLHRKLQKEQEQQRQQEEKRLRQIEREKQRKRKRQRLLKQQRRKDFAKQKQRQEECLSLSHLGLFEQQRLYNQQIQLMSENRQQQMLEIQSRNEWQFVSQPPFQSFL